MTAIDIQGVSTKSGDKVTFRVKHTYDKSDHTGTFIGYLHYSAAKKMYDLAPYYRGLRMADIDTTTPLESMEFVIISDEDDQVFAAAIDWIETGSFKKISNNSTTVKIMGIEDEEALATLLQQIRNNGYPVKVVS